MSTFTSRAHLITFDLQEEAEIVINGFDQIVGSPQNVTIAWRFISGAKASDLISLYAPHDADPTEVAPVQLINANMASGGTHSKSGSGKATFSILNHRTKTLGFKIISFDPEDSKKTPRILAISPPLFNKIIDLPSNGHLAVAEDAKAVIVQWISGSESVQQATYWLQWSDEPLLTVSSNVSSYNKEDMCGSPANSFGFIHPGFIHKATIMIKDTWPADSLVAYRYGSDGAGWGSESSFKIPPTIATGKPLVFLAFNDVAQSLNPTLFDNPPCPFGCKTLHWLPWCPSYCGGIDFNESFGANSRKLPSHLEAEEAHLALMIGDLSYAMGYGSDWDSFENQFEKAFRKLPLAVGVGNHERDWPHTGDAFDISFDSGGECGVPLEQRFYTPGTHDKRSYYSFDREPVHFLIIDSEIPTDPSSPQGIFIAQDLMSANRSLTPWVVAGLHRMMYAPASDRRSPVGDLPVEERLQRDLEDLFVGGDHSSGVDLVIQGHQHAYARTCQVFKGVCEDNEKGGVMAPVYILAGNAGASFSHGQPRKLPHWCLAAVENQNGYLRLTASTDALQIEAVSSDDGHVFDSITLGAR